MAKYAVMFPDTLDPFFGNKKFNSKEDAIKALLDCDADDNYDTYTFILVKLEEFLEISHNPILKRKEIK